MCGQRISLCMDALVPDVSFRLSYRPYGLSVLFRHRTLFRYTAHPFSLYIMLNHIPKTIQLHIQQITAHAPLSAYGHASFRLSRSVCGVPASLSIWDVRRLSPSCHSYYRSVFRPDFTDGSDPSLVFGAPSVICHSSRRRALCLCAQARNSV